MSKEITGAPAYSTEFNSLMEKLKNREEAKKMSDQELHNLREALDGKEQGFPCSARKYPFCVVSCCACARV